MTARKRRTADGRRSRPDPDWIKVRDASQPQVGGVIDIEQRLHLCLVQRKAADWPRDVKQDAPPDCPPEVRPRIIASASISLWVISCHTVCGRVAFTSPEEQRPTKRCAWLEAPCSA